ncbi:MAG: hypothetical protein JSR21_22605, partial [Proteobacteria bacterium]|nr:hypothetical protein [Pseudomonadota bacterium]
PALALAGAATAFAAAAAALPGAPASPAGQLALRLGVLAAVYLPGAGMLLRASVAEALRTAGLLPRPPAGAGAAAERQPA